MLDYGMRKKIEWAFYNYDTIKQRSSEYAEDIACTGITARYEAVVGGTYHVSNPTESKALKAASNTDEAWCRVVEKTKEHFKDSPLKIKFIEYRYKHKISIRQLCDNYYREFYVVEEKTFYNWLNEILTYAIMVAIQEKLLKV